MTEKQVVNTIIGKIKEGKDRPPQELWADIKPLFQRTMGGKQLSQQVDRLLQGRNHERALKLLQNLRTWPIPGFLIPLIRYFKESVGIVAFAFVFGIALTAFGLYYFQMARESVNWQSLPGKIIVSKIVTRNTRNTRGHSSTSRRAKIIYEFNLNGEIRQGKTVRYGWTSTSDIKIYPKGAAVIVYVDLLNPGKTTLEVGATAGNYVTPAIGIALVLASIIAAIIRGIRRRLKGRREKEVEGRKKERIQT